MNLIQRARILQTKLHIKYQTNKTIKKQAYKAFLHTTTRLLPSYRSMTRIRNLMILISIMLLGEPAIQTLLFYNTCFQGPYSNIHLIFATASLSCFGFALVTDMVIKKRWNHTNVLWFKKGEE